MNGLRKAYFFFSQILRKKKLVIKLKECMVVLLCTILPYKKFKMFILAIINFFLFNAVQAHPNDDLLLVTELLELVEPHALVQVRIFVLNM